MAPTETSRPLNPEFWNLALLQTLNAHHNHLAWRSTKGGVLLQMTMSLDGMVSGPKGELDWIANDRRELRYARNAE